MCKAEIVKLLKKYFADKPVEGVSIFDSFSTKTENEFPDIDIIIKPQKPLGLFTLGKYISKLEDITKIKIDLATENGLTASFREKIKNDLKLLYVK